MAAPLWASFKSTVNRFSAYAYIERHHKGVVLRKLQVNGEPL